MIQSIRNQSSFNGNERVTQINSLHGCVQSSPAVNNQLITCSFGCSKLKLNNILRQITLGYNSNVSNSIIPQLSSA
jgi:hypothetical protein